MIEITFQTFQDPTCKMVQIPFDRFYDELEHGETYEKDGVERYLDHREHINVDNDSVSYLSVKTPNYSNKIEYGKRGSITQHAIYPDSSEMLVVQSLIEPNVIHSVKVTKRNGEWSSSCIELIYDDEPKIVDIK
ncbi:hypothetical protein ACG1BZ_09770 [Microbulbifer sp. CNSA002]|uniref:hypothetical protein n=1 Tax=unclassified Microbulbifer TaxID=2619833 RepID=UPI0039B3A263